MTTVAISKKSVAKEEIGMLIFLAAEAMFFAGLISCYVVLRSQVVNWPPVDQPRLPVSITGFNTFILLLSGFFLYTSYKSYSLLRLSYRTWLFLSIVLGCCFLFIQGYEWVRLIHYGLATSGNIYAGMFYLLVGTHGIHVLVGLIYLIVMSFRIQKQKISPKTNIIFKVSLMYWLFVVAVWPILYALVYF